MYKIRIALAICILILSIGINIYYIKQKCPPTIVIGPVQPLQGMVGPITRSMTRKQIIYMLGKPVCAREEMKKDHNLYTSFDPIATDYFSGLYADIGWFNDDKVAYVVFNFKKSQYKYDSKFKVILKLKDEFILTDGTTRDKVVRYMSLKDNIPGYDNVLTTDNAIFLTAKAKSSVELRFSKSTKLLEYVKIGFYPQKT